MSKLDDLIKELCPNGVETVRLQDVAHYSTDRISAISVDAQHYVGVDNQLPNKLGKTDSSYVPVTGRPVGFKAGDVLIGNIRPYLKKIWLADIAGGTNGDVLVIRSNNKNELLPKYLYYILSSETFFLYDTQNSKGAKMPRGNKDSVMQYKLQVPPLPIQVEIVHILDNFTELTARKKQYSYYRDRLLSQSEPEGKFLKIEDICENISSGGTPQAGNSDYYGGSIPWLRTQEIDWRDICDTEIKITDAGLEQSSAKWIPENCVIVAMYGATAAKVAINKIPLTTNQACCNLQIDSTKANYRYVFHWLSNKYEELKALGQGSQSNINAKIVRNFPILVPSLDVQTRLVEVLDNFDAICSDLNIGLPAEIEARQKQYEYYRDALLTYAATGKIIDSTVQYSTVQYRDYNALIRICQYVFGVVFVELGSIVKVSMCKRIMKAETSAQGDVPFYKIGTFGKEPDAYITREKYEEYKAAYSFPKKGDILISAAGTIGRTVVYDVEPAYYQDSNIVWIDNDESIVLNSYLYYCYQLQPWAVSTGGTIARLYNDNICKAVIAVPTIKRQKEIVATLDRFDAICNDLTSGLPAEIEARKNNTNITVTNYYHLRLKIHERSKRK